LIFIQYTFERFFLLDFIAGKGGSNFIQFALTGVTISQLKRFRIYLLSEISD